MSKKTNFYFASITRRFEFDSAHRVLGHESKCAHLHGHRYVAEVTVEAPTLDGLGRVIDFSCLKTVIGDWINSNWDHNIILHPEDPLLMVRDLLNGQLTKSLDDASRQVSGNLVTRKLIEAVRKLNAIPALNLFAGKPPFEMIWRAHYVNPTAENLAAVLFDRSQILLKPWPSLKVTKVRMYETPNCWADFEHSLSNE